MTGHARIGVHAESARLARRRRCARPINAKALGVGKLGAEGQLPKATLISFSLAVQVTSDTS